LDPNPVSPLPRGLLSLNVALRPRTLKIMRVTELDGEWNWIERVAEDYYRWVLSSNWKILTICSGNSAKWLFLSSFSRQCPHEVTTPLQRGKTWKLTQSYWSLYINLVLPLCEDLSQSFFWSYRCRPNPPTLIWRIHPSGIRIHAVRGGIFAQTNLQIQSHVRRDAVDITVKSTHLAINSHLVELLIGQEKRCHEVSLILKRGKTRKLTYNYCIPFIFRICPSGMR
jgi:hypothetical protein